MSYNAVSSATQQKINEDVLYLSLDDILPDDFHAPLAPDDITLSSQFWNERAVFSPEETSRQTACLLAWERGQISGSDAMGYLDVNELIDFDAMLECYLAFLRAKAGGDL